MPTTLPLDDDHLHEECGVFGVYGHAESAALAALGLHALQHRGQEAAGIVVYDGEQFHAHRALGLVGENFSSKDVIGKLLGRSAIGHVRYATTGEVALRNVQPLFADFEFGGLAICHNGNLTNSYHLRRQLVRRGSLFQSTSDTEVIVHLIATSLKDSVVERLIDALRQVQGAYSLVALSQEGVIGVRDPLGVRPLVLGRLGEAWIIASETCALDIIGASFVRDVEPGELIVIDAGGLHSTKPFDRARRRLCIFEYIYFARPDSVINGRTVYDIRKQMGVQLAREAPASGADVIVPIPDSGVPAAIGFAQASDVPFELGIIRNHYIGRTFIEPEQRIRALGVKLKHSANASVIRGNRIVLVDDSVVRGTTSKKIVQLMYEAGAREVHMRIASPPITHPDYYGIDTPDKIDLLAANKDLEGMRQFLGADSLAFLSVEGIYRAVGHDHRDARSPQFTDHCFTGEYPTALTDQSGQTVPRQLSLLAEVG
jgi:amidophosphoribosyltransferase